jgi:hypothetical protein
VDPSGAVIPNVRVSVVSKDTGFQTTAITDADGRWVVSNLPSGNLQVSAEAAGFQKTVRDFHYDASRPAPFTFGLRLGAAMETVEVTAEGVNGRESQRIEREARKQAQAAQQAASVNVVNLQRRVAGVLPVAIDVPRAGTSFRFVRPLVLNEETKVTFSYKSR